MMCQAPPSKKRCLDEPNEEVQWFSRNLGMRSGVKKMQTLNVLSCQNMSRIQLWNTWWTLSLAIADDQFFTSKIWPISLT